MEKKTILGILREENNAKTKEYLSSKPSYATLLEKDIMIKRTAEELFRATKIIMRALNYKRLRRLRRESIFIADIYYEADPDIAKQIFLVGEFSTPQWGKQVLMQYSYFHRAFRAQIKIRQSSEFKFIVDGTFICCPKYPRLTTGGYTNNIFKKNPNPSGFNKSFHYEGVSLIMNDKRKWMIHSKTKTNKLSGLQLFNSFSRIRKDRSPRVDIAYEGRKKDFGIGIKHLHSSKAPKTPLQTIQKPLRSIISSEHNQSSRNLGSEYSDDDLFFLDDFFNNMPFTPDINGNIKDIGIHGISSPLSKEIVKNYCIVGQGFRLSKNKKPCQDAFFTTKFGIGIADGVGGWTSYGIDPAQFSNSLMSQ
mmetsp:Transcript_39580/g.39158  ORF Transcript_39580/g.39158 Transcript_39580/m.39158 type:complete len:363 (+) Transcript_39580:26-1114(+)